MAKASVGALNVMVGANIRRLSQGFRAAGMRVRSFAATVGKVGVQLARFAAISGVALVGGITAATVALGAAARSFVRTADGIEKMSRRTGVGAAALSQLGFAAEQSGADVSAVQKSLFRMQRTIGDAQKGLGAAQRAFDMLGLSIDEISKLSPEDQFSVIADALNKIEDASLRASLGQEILGRGFLDVAPLIAEGSEGIARLREEADALGLTITSEMAASARDAADTFNRLRRVLQATSQRVGHAVLPAFTFMADAIRVAVTNGSRMISNFFTGTVQPVFARIAQVVTSRWDQIRSVWLASTTAILTIGSTVFNAIKTLVGGVMRAVFGETTGALSGIVDA